MNCSREGCIQEATGVPVMHVRAYAAGLPIRRTTIGQMINVPLCEAHQPGWSLDAFLDCATADGRTNFDRIREMTERHFNLHVPGRGAITLVWLPAADALVQMKTLERLPASRVK